MLDGCWMMEVMTCVVRGEGTWAVVPHQAAGRVPRLTAPEVHAPRTTRRTSHRVEHENRIFNFNLPRTAIPRCKSPPKSTISRTISEWDTVPLGGMCMVQFLIRIPRCVIWPRGARQNHRQPSLSRQIRQQGIDFCVANIYAKTAQSPRPSESPDDDAGVVARPPAVWQLPLASHNAVSSQRTTKVNLIMRMSENTM